MRGLYAIVDVEALERRGLEPVRFAVALLAARPAALQIRDKVGGARRTLLLLRVVAPLAEKAGVPLFANDRPDLALLARCDGVHVGQEDVPVGLVRRVAPGLRVGLSTHDAHHIEEALEEGLEEGADYLAIGPVFPTASKDRPSPVVGLARLATFAARVRAAKPGLPVVAIGGVTLETAAAVGAIADAAAVIGALVPSLAGGAPGPRLYDDVSEQARALHDAIRHVSPARPAAGAGGAR